MASKKEKLEKAGCLLHPESLSLSGEPNAFFVFCLFVFLVFHFFHQQTQQSKAKQTNKQASFRIVNFY
jgi:hypothetical protein